MFYQSKGLDSIYIFHILLTSESSVRLYNERCRSSITLNSITMKKILLTIAAVAMIGMSGTAQAGVVNLQVGGTYSNNIRSVVNNIITTEGGGSIETSSLDGRKLDYLYCVDLSTTVNVNTVYPYTTVNNAALIHGSVVNNADKVAYLLENHGVGGQGDQAIALQAAIWHEIYGTGVYDLNISGAGGYGTGSSIATLYTSYVSEADKSTTGNFSKFIWINPGKDAIGLNNYQGLVTSSPTPEPSTYALMGIGGLFAALWFKKSSGTLAPTV